MENAALAAVCKEISRVISPLTEIFYPGDPQYEKGIFHVDTSSTERSKCVIEPGSAADVGKILVILGRTRTPFAVKGGGHASNLHFSSTLGVHISMSRFSKIDYHPETATVDVGAGLVWNDVYAALEPHAVTAIGGRVGSVGVAGLTLGGGYSLKSNQYGLAVDNVLAFELVKPDGEIVRVMHASDPELFFGLKGGLNNFGVVTEFTLKTFPQTQVWGGVLAISGTHADAMTAATAAFQRDVTDPKAALLVTYNYIPPQQQVIPTALIFYDAPIAPPGMFGDFLAIPSLSADLSTRSYSSLIRLLPPPQSTRTLYGMIPNLSFTREIGDLLLKETIAVGHLLANKSEILIFYGYEISLTSVYSHNKEKTAFPPVRNVPFQSLSLGYQWNACEFDTDFHDAAVASQARLLEASIALGQTDLAKCPIYPNHALDGTPLQKMYGVNLPALISLKKRVDPADVMGLAGGWKF